MSASKQKRERREARAQGTDKQTLRTQKEQEEAAKKRSLKIKIVAGVVAVAIVVGALVGVFASASTYRSVDALQVGSETISVAEYNYYYSNVRDNYLATYNEYMSMLGTSITAAEMERSEYEDGKTWGDLFHEEAQSNILRVCALVSAANAEGVTIGEDYQAAIDSSIGSLEQAAFAENVTKDEYLASMYGRGMDYDTWMKCAQTVALADSYMAQKMASYTFSDAEAITYYNENESAYQTYDYRSFVFTTNADAEDQTAAFAETRKQAEEFVSRFKAGEAFADLVLEYVPEDSRSYYEESDLTLYEDTVENSISSAYSDWVTDPARVEGDIDLVIDEENSYIYVLNYLGKSDATDAEKIEAATADMQSAAFEEWIAAEQEKYPLTVKSMGMYFADKAI